MSVIRTKRERDFTIVPNDALRDPTLSWAAKGLLSLMLSYPNDWRYSLKHLTTISRTGLHGTRTAFQELEAAGYVTRTLTQDDAGVITGYEYVVRDDKHTVVRKSDDGEDEHRRAVYRRRNSPTTEKPHATKTERPTKTESTKTEQPQPSSAAPTRDTFKPENEIIPDHLDRSEWTAFCQHRREIRKRLTPTTTTRLLALLERHPQDANTMLKRSIENGWTGVFPLDNRKNKPAPANTPDDYADVTPDDLLTPTNVSGRWSN